MPSPISLFWHLLLHSRPRPRPSTPPSSSPSIVAFPSPPYLRVSRPSSTPNSVLCPSCPFVANSVPPNLRHLRNLWTVPTRPRATSRGTSGIGQGWLAAPKSKPRLSTQNGLGGLPPPLPHPILITINPTTTYTSWHFPTDSPPSPTSSWRTTPWRSSLARPSQKPTKHSFTSLVAFRPPDPPLCASVLPKRLSFPLPPLYHRP